MELKYYEICRALICMAVMMPIAVGGGGGGGHRRNDPPGHTNTLADAVVTGDE